MTGITKWLVEHTVEDSSNQKAPMPRSGSRTMVALVVGCCALMWNAPREKGKRTGKGHATQGKGHATQSRANLITGRPRWIATRRSRPREEDCKRNSSR